MKQLYIVAQKVIPRDKNIKQLYLVAQKVMPRDKNIKQLYLVAQKVMPREKITKVSKVIWKTSRIHKLKTVND